jgi:sulfoxide reductase heme-binding subunit YedZ
MLGLMVYFYATLHALSYIGFDMGFEWGDVLRDIGKRPVHSGWDLSPLLFLTLLAATSFNRAIRILGAARWQALHKLVYLVAVLAILHFFWMRAGKNDFAEVSVYGAILCVLLGWRLARFFRRKRQ